jgi:hypothetical protein
MRTVTIGAGTIHYQHAGPDDGRPVVFIHGYMMASSLWRPLLERLADDGLRCIAPTWPLGSQPDAIDAGTDLTMEGVATMVIEFLERLGLDDVILVGSDTGGAIAQLVAGRRPERLGALVLTSCDAFEHFPPPILDPFIRAARRDARAFTLAAQPMRLRLARHRAYSRLAHADIDDLAAEWVQPVLSDPMVRENLRTFTASLDQRTTLQAAERLPDVDLPTLIAWSADDVFFALDDGRRLADTIPNARLEVIQQARTFSMLDQPDRLAQLIGGFARTGASGLTHAPAPDAR